MKKKPENSSDDGVAHARGIPFRHVYRLVFGSQADHALGTQEVIIVDAKLSFMLTIVGPSQQYQNAIWKQQMEKLLAQTVQQQQQMLAILTALQTQYAPSDDLLDNHDLCALLHVGTRTLHRWRSEGKLPPSKLIGGKHYYTRKVIMDMFNLK